LGRYFRTHAFIVPGIQDDIGIKTDSAYCLINLALVLVDKNASLY
jgi:hypothetical protein